MMGLPSLRTLDGLQTTRIWLAVEATDMRCGFDRLAERVSAVISQDPLERPSVCVCLAAPRAAEDPYLGP